MSIYTGQKVTKINTVSAPCGVSVDMISSNTHPHYVAGTIIRYLNAADPSGQVLLIAWVSYQNILFFPNRHRCIQMGVFP